MAKNLNLSSPVRTLSPPCYNPPTFIRAVKRLGRKKMTKNTMTRKLLLTRDRGRDKVGPRKPKSPSWICSTLM